MGAFEPIINILTVLTVLSVAAERATNMVKLRRHAQWQRVDAGRDREKLITGSSLVIGIALAIAMKADLFAMLAEPQRPWSTLGWTHWDGARWVKHASAASFGGVVQALLGASITGLSLGFGSRFWHDVLGVVLELRKLTQARVEMAQEEKTALSERAAGPRAVA